MLAKPPDPTNADWIILVKDFATKLPPATENQLRKLAEERLFPEAAKHLRTTRDAVQYLEGALVGEKQELVEPVLEAQQQLSLLDKKLNQYWEDVLYFQVARQRTRDACHRYIQEAPVRKRLREVEAYLAYLNGLEKPRDWNVELRVEWDTRYSTNDFPTSDEHKITVTVDKKEALVL